MYRHKHVGGRAMSIVAPRPRRTPGQGASKLPPIYIAFLNRLDIEELKMTDDEILSAIETSLASQRLPASFGGMAIQATHGRPGFT